MSPTKPPSVRRRQSLIIVDLQGKVEHLAAEKKAAEDQKLRIEKRLSEEREMKERELSELRDELENQTDLIEKRDQDINMLKHKMKWYESEVARLTKVYENMEASQQATKDSYRKSYANLSQKYEHKRDQLVSLSKEHSELQKQFSELQAAMDAMAQDDVLENLNAKSVEVEKLRAELNKAKETIRQLQAKRTSANSMPTYYLETKEDSYFASACYDLFDAVQHWCNKFSRLSDKDCLSLSKMKDEEIRDRVETVTLDDSGVRRLLRDRTRRRDVLMAVIVRIILDRIFNKYLFGLDMEERTKLRNIEKQLSENGPEIAVSHWRATTLTLLAMRQVTIKQRKQEEEAIVQEILKHVTYILPQTYQMPVNIVDALRNVVSDAVKLGVEMRCQRAEYFFVPPPVPDYDDDGNIASVVRFRAQTMSARGAEPMSNTDLENENALVRLVLFPMLLKRGTDAGDHMELESIVSKMQVLVTRPGNGRTPGQTPHSTPGVTPKVTPKRQENPTSPTTQRQVSWSVRVLPTSDKKQRSPRV